MKTAKRFFLGIISSALFAVGLTRAADRLDPVMFGRASSDVILKATAECSSDCTSECWIDSAAGE